MHLCRCAQVPFPVWHSDLWVYLFTYLFRTLLEDNRGSQLSNNKWLQNHNMGVNIEVRFFPFFFPPTW